MWRAAVQQDPTAAAPGVEHLHLLLHRLRRALALGRVALQAVDPGAEDLAPGEAVLLGAEVPVQRRVDPQVAAAVLGEPEHQRRAPRHRDEAGLALPQQLCVQLDLVAEEAVAAGELRLGVLQPVNIEMEADHPQRTPLRVAPRGAAHGTDPPPAAVGVTEAQLPLEAFHPSREHLVEVGRQPGPVVGVSSLPPPHRRGGLGFGFEPQHPPALLAEANHAGVVRRSVCLHRLAFPHPGAALAGIQRHRQLLLVVEGPADLRRQAAPEPLAARPLGQRKLRDVPSPPLPIGERHALDPAEGLARGLDLLVVLEQLLEVRLRKAELVVEPADEPALLRPEPAVHRRVREQVPAVAVLDPRNDRHRREGVGGHLALGLEHRRQRAALRQCVRIARLRLPEPGPCGGQALLQALDLGSRFFSGGVGGSLGHGNKGRGQPEVGASRAAGEPPQLRGARYGRKGVVVARSSR